MRDPTTARALRLTVILLAGASLAACATVQPRYSAHGAGGSRVPPLGTPGATGTNKPYQVGGIWYVPREQPHYDETGIASWYGEAFNMKATADGEIFDMNAMSAAHTTLPLPSMVEVTNLDNGRKIEVRVNDRGPFVGNRIIDLSHAAAAELGYDRRGLAKVRVRYLGPAPPGGRETVIRYAQARPAPAPVLPGAPSAPAVVAVAEEVVKTVPAAAPVAVASLTPPASPTVAEAKIAPAAPAPVEAPFQIQAGAFADQARALRAQAQLAQAGAAVIEPIERNGTTLYRVVLAGPSDEAEAFALRDRVAGIGFADARVVRPAAAF